MNNIINKTNSNETELMAKLRIEDKSQEKVVEEVISKNFKKI